MPYQYNESVKICALVERTWDRDVITETMMSVLDSSVYIVMCDVSLD